MRDDAKLCWITREQRDALDEDPTSDFWRAVGRVEEAFDAAPVPVERRRCVTHNAEYSCETARGEPLCWMSSERGHANPCRFVSVFEVPASPSDPTSETTT